MMKKKDNNLLNPDHAVESYLDNLLQEVPDEQATVMPLPLKDKIVLLADLDVPEPVFEQPIQAPDESVDSKQGEPEPEIKGEELEQPVERRHDFNYPIQCLMFKVADTQLSVPLIEMGSVLPWVDNMTQIPSSQSWSLGVLQHRGRNIRVVDTAGLLNIKKAAEGDKPKHILVFGDGDWALSCDFLGVVVKVESEDVQWSGPRNSGFSLGTIRGSLAQLLDPVKIMNYLENITTGE